MNEDPKFRHASRALTLALIQLKAAEWPTADGDEARRLAEWIAPAVPALRAGRAGQSPVEVEVLDGWPIVATTAHEAAAEILQVVVGMRERDLSPDVRADELDRLQAAVLLERAIVEQPVRHDAPRWSRPRPVAEWRKLLAPMNGGDKLSETTWKRWIRDGRIRIRRESPAARVVSVDLRDLPDGIVPD